MSFRLGRRRELWVPTAAGWALLALALAFAVGGLAAGSYGYLAQTQSIGHGLLVVEGWLPAGSIAGAVETYREGGYDLLVLTGGPIEDEICPPGFATYAERAAALVRGLGLREDEIAVVSAPASAQDRTFRSAVSLRQWAELSGRPVTAFDLYSYGPHARRSRWLYQRAFGAGVAVGVIAAPPQRYAAEAWWRTSEGARSVLSEAISWVWVRLFFAPGVRGSHEEQWGSLRSPSTARLRDR